MKEQEHIIYKNSYEANKKIARYTNNYCVADFQGAPEVSSSKVSERYTRLV